MKRIKRILNCISLVLTTGLLVMITFAWYAVNKTANVTGGSGSIADIDSIVDTVEYYNFIANYKDNNDTVYKVKNYVYTKNGSDNYQINYLYDDNKNLTGEETKGINFSMNPYDYLSRDITKYLIKIKLLPGKNISQLQFTSTANYFIGFDSNNNTGSVESVDELSMSSVIQFACFEKNSEPSIRSVGEHSNAEVVINSNPNYSHFDYTNNNTEYYGKLTQSKETIASNLTTTDENEQLVLYIVIDYNLEALNAFYSYNLQTAGEWGTSGHGKSTAPKFTKKDFKIFILG